MGKKNKFPFISKVSIKNFRNFLNEEVILNSKQVIIGENNVGKTNFIRAIQLILDPNLSDSDRELEESDFNDSIEKPFDNKEKIEISIEIKGIENHTTLIAAFCDGTVSKEPPTIRITYKFESTNDEYGYKIFLGDNENILFTHLHRKLLNVKVINGLRDATGDLKNLKKSPFNKLLNMYDIDKDLIEEIAIEMKKEGDAILNLEELVDLNKKINNSLVKIVGEHVPYSKLKVETIDINPSRILNTLKLMIGLNKQRSVSETSLGITNILYITLILLSIEDQTIPSLIKTADYETLNQQDDLKLLENFYEPISERYYKMKSDLNTTQDLYDFFDKNLNKAQTFTILIIEEPEAHLHPILQRSIYREVMSKNNSIILTTHSSDIASVSPIHSIVHLNAQRFTTKLSSSATLNISKKEIADIQRYLDVKRSELFFGKGVILVEGIAEEFLVPVLAKQSGINLDFYGVVCCNINSTNFKPYIYLLRTLNIPYVIFTDGDYYAIDSEGNRKYHIIHNESQKEYGYLGVELAIKTLSELNLLDESKDIEEKDLNSFGYYFSDYTLEVDLMMLKGNKSKIIKTFLGLTAGGEIQKRRFMKRLYADDYYFCLDRIEESANRIGKGRFAQRFSTYETLEVPQYIKLGLENLIKQIKDGEN